MTNEYVSVKIKEAIKAAGGDKQDAQKLLITWAVRDQSLLLGLTKPHLKAIVNSWIGNAMRPQNKVADKTGEEIKFSNEEIGRMVASSPGSGKRSATVPPPKSSARQASMMHHIAAAFRKRKK